MKLLIRTLLGLGLILSSTFADQNISIASTIDTDRTPYKVYQNQTYLRSFPNYATAYEYAKQWANARILQYSKSIWDNYPYDYSVTYHVYQKNKLLETFHDKTNAINFALLWDKSRVLGGKQNIWDNYSKGDGCYYVYQWNQYLGTFNNYENAQSYAEILSNTQIFNGKTNQMIWSKSKSNSVKPDKNLNFTVMSDIHIDQVWNHSIQKFEQALQDDYAVNPQQDALILNGDETNGTAQSYASLQQVLNSNPHSKNIYYSMGNHEYYNKFFNTANGVYQYNPNGFPNGYTDMMEISRFLQLTGDVHP